MINSLWITTRWALLPIVIGSFLLTLLLPEFRWASELFHVMLESGGSLIGFGLAFIVVAMIQKNQLTANYTWLIGCFITMGILDTVHSQQQPGEIFVWLHSIATLFGGLFAMLIWLPKAFSKHFFKARFLWLVIGLSAVFCIVSVSWPELAFKMLDSHKKFTAAAISLNLIGGLGFLIAWFYFALEYHRKKNTQQHYFANHFCLFALAGFVFELSSLWDANWWFWHMLRAFAYLFLIYHFATIYRKHLISSLDKSESRYQDLINSSPDWIWEMDKNAVYTYASPNVYKHLGYQPDEVLGKSLFDFMPSTQAKKMAEKFSRISAAKQAFYNVENNNIHKKGHSVILESSGIPIISEDDELLGYRGVDRDITKRKQIAATLHEAEQRLRLATEAAEIGIWEWNIKNNSILWDAQMFRIYGLEPTEDGYINYTDWRTAVVAEELEQQEAILQETIRTHVSSEREFHINRHSDNQNRIIHAVESVRINDSGEVEWVIGTNRDITQTRQAEEQLRRSQKMDALGKLTGGIAHDFNNMLGVILGYTELLNMKSAGDETFANYTNEILVAGNRAKKLTSKLLAFSRIQPSDAKPTIINTQIQNDRHMLEKTLTALIKIELNLDKDLWSCLIDEELLGDTILNMGINAMHAMPKGGTFSITTKNCRLNTTDTETLSIESGDYIQLTLKDTGIGMDKNTLHQIFEPFFSTKGEQGTGLGMSQVYGFIKQAHGDIRVHSKPDQGTEIIIHLPRYEGDHNIDTETDIHTNINNSPGSETILVVDDEPALREMTKAMLEPEGYNILTADGGKTALQILAKEAIDLMLCDVIMPDMNGYELAEKVRQQFPNIKIQMASGYSDGDYISDTNKQLHEQRLQKPYDVKTLLQKIREQLDG